jgi:hypothetical protein
MAAKKFYKIGPKFMKMM